MLKEGGRFYATIFKVSKSKALESVVQCEDVTTHPYQDPFHYKRASIEQAAPESGFILIDVEEFNPPRNQKIAIFE